MFSRIITLMVAFSLWGCGSPTVPTYKESTIQFVNQLRPQLLGSWQLKQAQIDAEKLKWSPNYTGITRDTVLQNLATLTLKPFTGKVYVERLLDFDGSIRFREKEYPVEVRIYPMREATNSKGVMWVGLRGIEQSVKYDLEDIKFMESIGLVGVNFDFDTEFGQPTMTLQTTDKGIALANLVKDR